MCVCACVLQEEGGGNTSDLKGRKKEEEEEEVPQVLFSEEVGRRRIHPSRSADALTKLSRSLSLLLPRSLKLRGRRRRKQKTHSPVLRCANQREHLFFFSPCLFE